MLHLPRKTKVDVTKCWPAMQNDGGCRQVPCLPRKTTVDVAKCHACHAKWRGVTGDQRGPSAPPDPAQCHKRHACQGNEGRCRQLPRLPGKTTVDVAKCYACHAKCRGVTGDQRGPSAPPDPAQCEKCGACHAKHGSFVLKDGV